MSGASAETSEVGLTISASNSTVRGLVINGWSRRGVQISGSGARGNKIEGNFIGTKADGVGALGNSEHGVSISDPDNTVGGAVSARNVIAFNGGDGVSVFTSDDIRNRILSNSIYNNGELGIDLFGNDGVTANDNGPPPDTDTGANNLQNFPVISSAVTSEGSTTVRGSLKSTANKTFILQFFSSPFRDTSGFGEGKTFLGQKTVTTNDNGNASFTFTLARTAPGGQSVTATATDPSGNTSEYSKARQVTELV